jgi:hypothetical protein
MHLLSNRKIEKIDLIQSRYIKILTRLILLKYKDDPKRQIIAIINDQYII